jgi:glycosyltransferase involved in cell wall biosynthesis
MNLSELLTIVIPCKNEGPIIKRTLKYLNSQHGLSNVNVIIADSSDDNGQTSMAIQMEVGISIKISVIPGGLPAVARNLGADSAATKYVLFLDADIYLRDPYLLLNIVNQMELDGAELGTCKIRTDDSYSLAYMFFDVFRWLISHKTPFAVGGFMLFNREAFNRIGRFNEEDLIAEDYHISKKIHPSRFRVYPEVAYTTPRRFQKKGLFYMVKIMLDCWFNRDNEEFYKRDYKYFQ